jgi:predicted ATPase
VQWRLATDADQELEGHDTMPMIEGFRVKNFKALKDVTIGKLSGQQEGEILTPLTVVIGKNGCGKSTLLDAFGFIADCLNLNVEAACDQKQRGGFDRLKSKGSDGPLYFEIYYREAPNERPITYEISIAQDRSGGPFIESEILKQRRRGQRHGRPYPFLRLNHGKGYVWAGEEALEVEGEEDRTRESVELTDLRQLGIGTLGTLKEHPRIKRFRDFLKGWYLSYFDPDAARSLPNAGPQRHLNVHGDNMGNVVQFMQREHKSQFDQILRKISRRIPGISSIDTHITEDKRVLLRFNDGAFEDPFFFTTDVGRYAQDFCLPALVGGSRSATVHLHRRTRKRSVSQAPRSAGDRVS